MLFCFPILAALPGGGKAGALWSSTNLSSSHGRPSSGYGRPKTAEQKKRGYEKPWLSGTKPATKKTAQTTEHKPEKSAPEHRETSGFQFMLQILFNLISIPCMADQFKPYKRAQ